jgi:hypothetical protein
LEGKPAEWDIGLIYPASVFILSITIALYKNCRKYHSTEVGCSQF